MSREIRRVPLDFNWPLNKVWKGYLNPEYSRAIECSLCDGSGYSPFAKHLRDQWYGYVPFDPEWTGSKPFLPSDATIQLFATRNIDRAPDFYGSGPVAITREATRLATLFNARWSHHLDQDDINALCEADRLWDFTRTPRTQEEVEIVKRKIASGKNSWLPFNNGYIPSTREVNEWSIHGLGHDSINLSVCIRAKAKRLGQETTCPQCSGHGSLWTSRNGQIRYKHRYQRHVAKRIDTWKQIEPPTGRGYQLWETVSEGSPISPVFATAKAFEDYLVSEGASRKAARSFMGTGWCFSATDTPNGFKTNIQTCEEFTSTQEHTHANQ